MKHGIGELIKDHIAAGSTNEEILEVVKAKFPNAKTTVNSIRWYRSKMKQPAPKASKTNKVKPKRSKVRADAGNPTYSVRKVKTFLGMEGYGFNAELLRDGKPVAFVIDSAYGGCYDYQWYDPKEETIFRAHIADRSDLGDFEPYDVLVARLVDEAAHIKRIAGLMKSRLRFTVKGKKGSFYVKHFRANDPRAREYVAKKYGNSATILQDLPIEEAAKILMAV